MEEFVAAAGAGASTVVLLVVGIVVEKYVIELAICAGYCNAEFFMILGVERHPAEAESGGFSVHFEFRERGRG